MINEEKISKELAEEMVHESNTYWYIRHWAYCLIYDEEQNELLILMQYEAKTRSNFWII